MTTTDAAKKGAATREYVVFGQTDDGTSTEGFAILGRAKASSDRQAIERVVGDSDPSEYVAYVAVPERSWRPVAPPKVETTTRLRWS